MCWLVYARELYIIVLLNSRILAVVSYCQFR